MTRIAPPLSQAPPTWASLFFVLHAQMCSLCPKGIILFLFCGHATYATILIDSVKNATESEK